MDHVRFDRLTRTLAAGASRRRLLGGLGAAAATVALGQAATAAPGKGKGGGKGKGNGKGKGTGGCMKRCTTTAKGCRKAIKEDGLKGAEKKASLKACQTSFHECRDLCPDSGGDEQPTE